MVSSTEDMGQSFSSILIGLMLFIVLQMEVFLEI
jgi:hypothetical protein